MAAVKVRVKLCDVAPDHCRDRGPNRLRGQVAAHPLARVLLVPSHFDDLQDEGRKSADDNK